MSITLAPTDSTQASPYWVVGVVRFKDRVTYDKTAAKSLPVEANAELEPIVITDATMFQASSSRGSHISMLQVSLPPSRNYLTDVFPGDWVCGWIVNGQDKYKALVDTLNGKGNVDTTDPQYGLKFVGKVQNVNARTSVERNSGVIRTMYQLTAVGFSEFDTSLFYLPQITQSMAVPVMLNYLGIGLTAILGDASSSSNILTPADTGTHNAQTVKPDKMLNALLSCIFGMKGPFAEAAKIKTPSGNLSQSPNAPYIVPKTVSKWLGVQGTGYEAILHFMVGLQHYDPGEGYDSFMPSNAVFQSQSRFANADSHIPIPSGGYANTIKCDDLLGDFSVVTPPLNNITVWSLLSNYTNVPVNDMYVALKPLTFQEAGRQVTKIMPTLVVRQNVFSTDLVTTVKNVIIGPQMAIDKTKFSELPRWVIPNSLVYDMSISRSNAARINYATAIGSPELMPVDQTKSMVLNPPVQDTVDIQRHGLRPYMPSTNCLVMDWVAGPERWKMLLADIVIGEHHTLSGTLTTTGIYEPIAVGDNIEFAGVVYHVESVNHSATIAPNGTKGFQTALTLSHGVVANPDSNIHPSVNLYPKIVPESDVDPSITVEG